MTAQTSFKSANQLLREGKLDQAVAAYRQAITVNPGFSHAHHNLGEALVKAGRFDEAVAAFRRAVELNPQGVWSLFKLGELLRGQERFEEAAGFLRRAVELKSDVAEFNLGLGAALVRLGSTADEGGSFLRRAVELNPFLAEGFYFLGAAASGRQQWSEAVEFYGRGLELNPSGVECGLGLAEALGKLGRWSEAVERYGEMVLASGESGEVCFGLGQALGQLGRWEEAVVEYGRAISLGFAGAEVRHHLGYALGQLGRWEEAVVEYRWVVEVNPKSAPVRHQLGYGLMRLGRWGEAAVELRRSVELYPGSAVVWQQLGDVLRELGEDEEAVGVYRRALEIKPGLAGVEERLAGLLRRKEIKESWFQKEGSTTEFSHDIGDRPLYKIGIKTSVPNLSESSVWGDFHFAHALKLAFEKLGHTARVDCNDAWEREGLDDDVVIVLRGRHGYKPKPSKINLLWLISHPDRVTNQELNLFDHVFVASKGYAHKLSKQLQAPVSCMYQCTDPVLFDEVSQGDVPGSKVLFVGSSRNVFRPIIRDSINQGIDVEIYGPLWEQFISKKHIKGTHVPNDLLHKYYSNCAILLNDHWETMRQEGFLSNRLFDGSACGAFIITDKVVGLNEVFGDCLETYEYPSELSEKIAYYLENKKERHHKASKAKVIVRKNHTFEHRAKQFLEIIASLKKRKQKTLNNQFKRFSSEAKNVPSQRLLYSSISELETGLCNIEVTERSVFYQWLWRISRRTPGYQDFVSKFAISEAQLLELLYPLDFGNEKPLVSIIMPTFNRAYVIAEAIQSIVEQSYANWELFVCDDGSTDNTKAVVKQFEDSRVNYLQLQKANGAVARNFGLRAAQGKYIAYLDSDNIWHPQHLMLCVQNLEIENHVMCCYTGYIDTESQKTTLELKSLSCKAFNYYRLLDRNFIDLNSFVHHRKLYEWLGGFDETLARLQDWDLVLRYLFLFQPLVLENFTVFYRRNVAWSQVTKLFMNLDIRSVVQKKMIHAIENDQTLLSIKYAAKPSVSLLCSEWSEETWLKALAFGNALSEIFEVQIVFVTDSMIEKMSNEAIASNLEIQFIDTNNFASNLQIQEILSNQDEYNCTSKVLNTIAGDVLIIIGDCAICKAVALVSRIVDNRALVIWENLYKKIIKNLHEIVEKNHQIDFVSRLEGRNRKLQKLNAVNLESLCESLENSPPTLIKEINSENSDIFSSITVGPTVIELSVPASHLEKNNSRQNLKKMDLVVAFWSDAKTIYPERELVSFQDKLHNFTTKIILINGVGQEANKAEKIKNSEGAVANKGLTAIRCENEQQAIGILEEADICVCWKGEGWRDFNSLVSLSFVYALAASCVPVCNEKYQFFEWGKPNYCCHVKSRDWNQLVKVCNELYDNPKKLAQLKLNGRRLYNLKFSPTVTREKLKYVIYNSLLVKS